MRQEKNSFIKAFLLLAVLLILAILYDQALNYERFRVPGILLVSILIIICLNMWIAAVRLFFSQKAMRSFTQASILLMILLIVICALRDASHVQNAAQLRMCYYLIMVLLIFIPVLTLMSVLCMGKHEDYQPPACIWLLLIPSAFFSLSTLLNDQYKLVFPFEGNEIVYRPAFQGGIIFYLMLLWFISTELTKVIISMRLGKRLKRLYQNPVIPLILLFVFAVFAVVYFWYHLYRIDGCVSFCIIFFYYEFELYMYCVGIGTVPLTRDYAFAFVNSTMNMQIIDSTGKHAWRSAGARDLTPEMYRKLKEDGCLEDGDHEYHRSAFSGGEIIWEKDIGALNEITKALDQTREELKSELALQSQEAAAQAEERRVLDQNLLYDTMSRDIHPQILYMQKLLSEAEAAASDEVFHACMKKVCLIGTYVKRRCNFLLQKEAGDLVSSLDLQLCFREIGHALDKVGITQDIVLDSDFLPEADFAIRCLDLYEQLMEKADLAPDAVRIRLHKNAYGNAVFSVSMPCRTENLSGEVSA